MFHYDNIKQPKTRKGRETFERIVRAGEKLFHLLTYPVASITDIARKRIVLEPSIYILKANKVF